MSWLDNAISVISPKIGFERLQYRHARELQQRSYDAASNTRRTKNWKAGSTSQNAEVTFSLQTLRNRSRDLVRNNPYAGKAIGILTDNVIGCGIQAAPVGKKTKIKPILDAWNGWANSTMCDIGRQMNFAGLQRLFSRTMFESGECIIRQVRRNNGAGNIPIALQVLEPDHIDTNKAGNVTGGFIVQGVEYNNYGERVAYWLYDVHPGDIMRNISFISKRVPAEEVIHLYRVDRPGQVRGIPEGVSAFIRMKDLDSYADAQLMRQRIAACFTVFIQDTVNVNGAAADYANKTLEPGAMEVLPPGRTMTFTQPPLVQGYDEYTRTVIREFSIAYGVTYEALTGDLSRVNFSSARMGFLEFGRRVEMLQELVIIPMALNVIWDWFIIGARVAGIINKPVAAGWTCPKRQAVDPVKEIAAIKAAVRAGLMSRPEAIRQLGYDPTDVTEEIAEDNKLLDEKKILLDTDPRADATRTNAVNGIVDTGNGPNDGTNTNNTNVKNKKGGNDN